MEYFDPFKVQRKNSNKCKLIVTDKKLELVDSFLVILLSPILLNEYDIRVNGSGHTYKEFKSLTEVTLKVSYLPSVFCYISEIESSIKDVLTQIVPKPEEGISVTKVENNDISLQTYLCTFGSNTIELTFIQDFEDTNIVVM